MGTAVYGFVVLSVLVLAVAAAALFMARSESVLDEALDSAVRKRTEAAGQDFARALHADWADLKYLSGAIDGSDLDGIGEVMAGMRGDGTRISWIGYAGVDGTVREASDGLLVGADVSERPWFRNGLRSGFAGDVHEAVLLANLLRPEGGEPLRFVDLALPVKNLEGDLTGVLGMHIDAGWAERSLAEMARSLGIDLYLISQSGEIVMSSTGTTAGVEEVMQLASARSGAEASGRAEWSDGREYFTTLVPNLSYADLPNFGWRLAGRLDAGTFQAGLHSLVGSAALAAALALAVLALLTFLFVLIFIRPIDALVDSATQLAAGEDAYPRERNSTREAAQLSAALARLQARRKISGS
ncbi:cache domain-containing protein [Pseudooceanicola nanhaiensis]|uniref:cache domain-containing protein n=1 Tax=Pseudooceanicola nanhaiensis TaxID=375761 RepID=UPI001CD51D92|nr:cache domain-containing protein [Pseudooceanicola nanhaiensis]MCA0919897.1 cache domain-containing protein [Pseudooceanicola nanhaiensis]